MCHPSIGLARFPTFCGRDEINDSAAAISAPSRNRRAAHVTVKRRARLGCVASTEKPDTVRLLLIDMKSGTARCTKAAALAKTTLGERKEAISPVCLHRKQRKRANCARPKVLKRGPRHYHLLWDEELEALRPVLRLVLEHLEEVIAHWYQLYVLHFGDTRSLSEPEFRDLFYNALSRNTKDLLEGDMDRYAIDTIRTGELLCERNVPFAEIVASLHLYEESAYTAFPKDPAPPLEIYTAFDKLSHIRMILLADAYFRSASASAGARIQALERQATLVAREKRSSLSRPGWLQPIDAASLRPNRSRGRHPRHNPDRRRKWDRERTGSARDSRVRRGADAPIRCTQLCRDSEGPDRERAVWIQEGRVQRCECRLPRTLPRGRRRHAVSRRSHRDGAGDAEQALARRAGTNGAAGGLDAKRCR